MVIGDSISAMKPVEFRFTNRNMNNCVDEIKEQLVIDGGAVMGECLLNVIDDTLYECCRNNKILILPGDYFTISWTAFKLIEADNRITVTQN